MSRLERGLQFLRELSNVESVEDAASALCLIVNMYADEPGPPLDSRYQMTADCRDLVEREPELHELLKRAHAAGSYDLVRASDLIRKQLPEQAQQLLNTIRPLLATFIADPTPITSWESDPKPRDLALLAHIESLELWCPETRGLPLVILKDLGSFMEDAVLSSRVKNLFVRGQKTVLVNASGSGKTRLLFEGLCHNWGLYFLILNIKVVDLGSRDIGRVVENLTRDRHFSKDLSTLADASPKLEYNHSIAERRLSEALLARLLIFRMFLDIAKEGGLTEDHKKKWLILQLLPSLGDDWDIFEALMRRIRDHDTQHDIAAAFDDIREMLGSDSHLFLALDEGQAASSPRAANTSFPCAFDTAPGKHPLLLKILDTWDRHFPAESISTVIAGTEIPRYIFEGTTHAVRWTSDTGSFDNPLLHERYLRRFLPPSLLATQLGKEFIQRAWAWTRGRHRYTASLMTEMLVWNFQQPNTVLDSFILKSTQFEATDGGKWIASERKLRKIVPDNISLLDFFTHEFSPLYNPDAKDTRFTLRGVVFHYLAADRALPLFPSNKIQTVSLGLGRFVDGEMSEIAIDEPIALAGVAGWMTQKPANPVGRKAPVHNYLTSIQTGPPPTAKAFAACLAFYFSRVFDSSRKLSEIFTFPAPPPWADQSAELVELHAEGGNVRYSVIPTSDIVAPLATSATSLDEVVSWMEHSNPARTAFCIPEAEAPTPDLIFVLKLADGAYIWIIMQVALTTSDGSNLLNCLEEARLFRGAESDADLTLHQRGIELLNTFPAKDRASESAAPPVLRVVASFQNQINLPKRIAASEVPAQASLCLDLFHKLTAELPPSDFVKTVVANLLKRKHEVIDDEKGKGRERKGKGRETKRQNSMPIDFEEEEEVKEERVEKKTRTSPQRTASPQPRYDFRPRPPKKELPEKGRKGQAKSKQKK
ncbi:hypothetical protein K438DRAFT_1730060 [Mycena galopus ATCC 62051]|nr:hypothetical protein K438DRAFT_1730060 [Mycena galopus ATCC 62051]